MIKKPKLEIAIGIMLVTILVLYGAGARMIFKGVQKYAVEAQAIYGGDHVGALIALLEDENVSFEEKNSAIWALGQIGSKRALPVLQALEYPPNQKAPYDSTAYIVEYSVTKAVKQINGISITRWMYRFL